MLGFPLPFYKSDTLRLSLGLSWDVFTRVRAAASCAPSQVSRSPPSAPLPPQLREWRPDVLHVACPARLSLCPPVARC